MELLNSVENGVLRDFNIKLAMAKDQHWFDKTTGPWRFHLMHPWYRMIKDETGGLIPPIDYNFWRNRVRRLCAYEITHQNFGLGYNDLMKLDPATFEEIEQAVSDNVKETNKQYQKLQLDANAANGKASATNFLKGALK